MKKLNVIVLFGGRSTEHEVSVRSAKAIADSLDRSKFNVTPIAISKRGTWLRGPAVERALETGGAVLEGEERVTLLPDPTSREVVSLRDQLQNEEVISVVFPVLHGKYGEDGALQGLLEMANLPYVGCGVLSSALNMDKVLQKQVLAYHGIPIVKFAEVRGERWKTSSEHVITEIETVFHKRYPLFVKPANTGSSVGISKARNQEQLRGALQLALEYDVKAIVEEGVDRIREIETSVLGNHHPEASVCGEIIPATEFYDYDSKYNDDRTQLVIPAAVSGATAQQIQEIAKRAYIALECRGLSRVDFFVTKDSPAKIYLNEINTLPGFTSMSMYPKLWEASGVMFSQLVEKLISLAVQEWEEKQGLKTSV